MEELRQAYIVYQSRFYGEDMQSQIEQSDQNRAILRGEYDDIINKDFIYDEGALHKKGHYLLTRRTYFVDPHDYPDFGRETKEIASYIEHNAFETGVEYVEDWEQEGVEYPRFDEDYQCQGSEDGYNVELTTIEYKSITEEQAVDLHTLITNYNNL